MNCLLLNTVMCSGICMPCPPCVVSANKEQTQFLLCFLIVYILTPLRMPLGKQDMKLDPQNMLKLCGSSGKSEELVLLLLLGAMNANTIEL